MQFPHLNNKTIAALTGLLTCGCYVASPAAATVVDPPLPVALIGGEEPMEDHTAQDGPMEDHTAQDGAQPGENKPKDPPRWETPPAQVFSPRIGTMNPLIPGDDTLQIPLMNLMDLPLPAAPDARDFAGGPLSAESMPGQWNFDAGPSDDSFNSPVFRTTSTAVPTPGALMVIGLGGLLSARRRRR